MFTVLLLLSFLVIGIITGLNFKNKSQEDQTRGLLSDDITPIPFHYKGDKGLCSDGWVLYKNACYLIGNFYGTWELSKSLWHEHGAHLMVVNSEEDFWDENKPAHWDIESCVYLKGSDTVHRKLMHDADCHSERYHIFEQKLETSMW